MCIRDRGSKVCPGQGERGLGVIEGRAKPCGRRVTPVSYTHLRGLLRRRLGLRLAGSQRQNPAQEYEARHPLRAHTQSPLPVGWQP